MQAPRTCATVSLMTRKRLVTSLLALLVVLAGWFYWF